MTNLVGVLIIVVMVVGARARNVNIPAIVKSQASEESVRPLRHQAIEAERDVERVDLQIKQLNAELATRREERELIATILVASEKEIADRRAKLDEKPRGEYDMARDLALAQKELEALELDRARSDSVQPVSLKIESYPTPLAKPVNGNELHLQLREGRVTVVPVNELVERLKKTAKDQIWKLRDYPQMTDTVGPIEGFRMRYTLVRVDAGGQAAREAGQGSYVQLDHWELVPVASDLGEPWQEALSETSRLRARLDETNPRQWTVTLWVYPDSFDAFRAMRKEFYQLGYHVAGRPLPDSVLIGGSPRGTKSAAQ